MTDLSDVKGFCKDYLLFSNLIKTNVNYSQIYVLLYNYSRTMKRIPVKLLYKNTDLCKQSLFNIMKHFVGNGLLINVGLRNYYNYYVVVNKNLFLKSLAEESLNNIKKSNKVNIISK